MPRNESAKQIQNKRKFEKYRQEALQAANKIVTGRVQTRDTDTSIQAKMPFGLASYVTFIFHKASRLVSMTKARDKMCTPSYHTATEEFKALEASIDEELLDVINYCSFAWAYRQMQEQREPSTVCSKGAFGDAPVSCLCPKCCAERAEEEPCRST